MNGINYSFKFWASKMREGLAALNVLKRLELWRIYDATRSEVRYLPRNGNFHFTQNLSSSARAFYYMGRDYPF
jgi:hypothetical protein